MSDRGFTEQTSGLLLWAAAATAAVILLAACLFLGELNQDEGWYLYGAGRVAQGALPYVDFATTQGPVMPFVYAVAHPFIARWGMAGGRAFTAVLGVICCILASVLARRLAPRAQRDASALLTFMLLGVNVYQATFFTLVKTYALAACLLMMGFLALAPATGRPGAVRAALSGGLFALAAGTRTSAAAALAAVLLCLWFRRPGADQRAARGAAVWFAAGAAAVGAAVFLPFVLRAPRAVWFALVEYHAGRDPGGPLKAMAFRMGFAARLLQAYSVAAVLALFGFMFRGVGSGTDLPHGAPGKESGLPWTRMLWCSAAAVTALHLAAPFPYDDYQVFIYPVFVVAVAVTLGRLAERTGAPIGSLSPPVRLRILTWVFAACVAAAAASPIAHEWALAPRDRIWWPLKTETPLACLRRAARHVRSLAGRDATLLTQDTYLAVEAGMTVPPGLELGPFSYFPEWPRDKAETCHVLNREMMRELLLTSTAPVAALSGYGLSVRLPSVSPVPAEEAQGLRDALGRRYTPESRFVPFGQAGTALEVFVRRAN